MVGYYPVDYPGDKVAQASLEANGRHIDAAAYFGYVLGPDGSLSGFDDQALMNLARQQGQKVLATVHNYRNGGFDRWGAHNVLTNPSLRARAADRILQLMQRGFHGVNLDLENVDPADRASYTAFVRDLAARLKPAGYLVTLAVPAKSSDNPAHGWSGAYDYTALGDIADYLMVMAYDEHWLGGTPGPVASLPWVEQMARYTASALPKGKVLFGLPTYGYDWADNGQSALITATQAAKEAASRGIRPQWDAQAQSPHYTYWDARGTRHQVYFENASSTAAKADLVARYGFAGVALWRLGYEDASMWQGVIAGKLRQP